MQVDIIYLTNTTCWCFQRNRKCEDMISKPLKQHTIQEHDAPNVDTIS